VVKKKRQALQRTSSGEKERKTLSPPNQRQHEITLPPASENNSERRGIENGNSKTEETKIPLARKGSEILSPFDELSKVDKNWKESKKSFKTHAATTNLSMEEAKRGKLSKKSPGEEGSSGGRGKPIRDPSFYKITGKTKETNIRLFCGRKK